jgi:hypothetical protein
LLVPNNKSQHTGDIPALLELWPMRLKMKYKDNFYENFTKVIGWTCSIQQSPQRSRSSGMRLSLMQYNAQISELLRTVWHCQSWILTHNRTRPCKKSCISSGILTCFSQADLSNWLSMAETSDSVRL